MATYNVKNTDTKRALELTTDFGKDVQDAIKKFGAEVVFSLYEDAATIQAQGKARAMLGVKKGADGYKSDETIKKEMSAHKPHIGRKSDPVKRKARMLNTFKNANEAERAEILAMLTGKPQLVKKGRAA